MTTIRCSSVDRVLQCSASLAVDGPEYNPNTPEATEGTACHGAMVRVVTGEGPTVEDVSVKFGLDSDTIAQAVSFGAKAWGEIAQWFPDPHCEVAMETELAPGVILRGHADVIGASSEMVSVDDHKFGWSPSIHTGQIRSYSYLARSVHGMPPSGFVLGVETWVRARELRMHKFRDEDLDRLRDELLDAIKHPDHYGPSADACHYCPRQLDCQARAEWLRSGVTALVPLEENQLVTRELVADIYDRTKQLGAALRRYDEVLRQMLEEGPLALSDGRVIAFEDREQEQIRASKAMQIIREELQLTPDEADEAITITKSGIERVLKARAPKGKAAAYMRETLGRLREVGAIEKIQKRMMKVSKPAA